MKRRLAAAAGALLLLALLLLAALPARLAWERGVAPVAPRLAAAEISGPWWRGQVRGLRWRDTPLGDLAWRPGAGGWKLTLAAGDDELTARAPWRFNERRLHEIDGSHPATILAPLLPAAPAGTLHAELDSVALQAAPRIRGRVEWRHARLGGPVDVALGTLELDLKPEPAGTKIHLASGRPGDVTVRGAGRLRRDGYRLRIDMRARPGRAALARQLRRLGTPRPDGSVRITLKDNWQWQTN